MSYVSNYPNKISIDRAIGHEGRVRFGSSAEPWHSLALWYHYDTPMPKYHAPPWRRRDSSLGQIDSSVTTPLLGIAGGLAVLALLGGAVAERHQRSLYTNRRRSRRNRRRRR